MQLFCPNCRTKIDVADDAWDDGGLGLQTGFSDATRTYQVLSGYNPEIVFHECPGVRRNVGILRRVLDDE